MNDPLTTHEQSPTYRARILVVDDSVDSAAMLRLLLKHAGYLCQCAYDGPEAVAAAIEFLPDIVLLDLTLPSMSGLQVAEQIRKIPNIQPRIIVMSGWEPTPNPLTDHLFDDYLIKPINPIFLINLLAESTSHRNEP